MFLHIFKYHILDFGIWTHREVGLFMVGITLGHYDICFGYISEKVPHFIYNDMSDLI